MESASNAPRFCEAEENPGRLAPLYRLSCSCLVLVLGSLFSLPLSRAESARGEQEDHPLIPAIRLAEESLAALNEVQDYTAIITKRELVGRKLIDQQMRIKFRQEPFSVYLFFEKPSPGREVLYVAGQNGGKLLVHEGGFASIAGTFSFLPTDPKVMSENRHPITQIGIHRMLEIILEQWKAESKMEGVEVRYYPNAKIREQPCRVIESNHTQPAKEARFYLTRLYIDKKTTLPIRIEQYGWPASQGGEPPLVEMYLYQQIRTNPGLTDHDFSSKNRQYKF